jgi:hypothetical protein
MLPLLLAAVVYSSSAGEEIDPARVAEISAMLRDEPQGLGRPVSDRVAWEKAARKPAVASVIPQAEALLGQPIAEIPDELYLEYSRTGNRRTYQDPEFERRGRLPVLVLAECIEDGGRFLPQIRELVAKLCEEKSWVLPAHDRGLRTFKGETMDIDLGSSALGWSLALTDYLLAERLPDDTRTLIHDNLERRILGPFRAMVRGERQELPWMRVRGNHNAVDLAGVTGAALAVLENPDDRAWFIAAAERYIRNYLLGFPPDGSCSEGIGYWNYGFGHYTLLAEAVSQATGGGVDLFSAEGAREPALYGARIPIIGGVCPAFADCEVTEGPDWHLMRFLNQRLGLGLTEYAVEDPGCSTDTLAACLAYSFPNSATSRPLATGGEGYAIRTWFADAGVLIGRPREGSACRMGVALKGGNNAEQHNHNDVGGFVVVLGKTPIILDPGPEVYTGRTFSVNRYDSKLLSSFGHSVPVVAGKLQSPGREQRAEVLETTFTDADDTMRYDLRSAYDVPELTRLVRTFTYSRDGAGALTVHDDVAFSTAMTYSTALILKGEWREVGPGVLEISDSGEMVRVEISVEGADYALSAERIDEDASVHPTRLSIDLTAPVTACQVTVRITPAG